MSIYQGNKKVLGGVSNIEEDKVKEIIDKHNTYQEEETLIGTWFGKPLYRKTIVVNDLSCTTTIKEFTLIDNTSIMNIKNINGSVIWGNSVVPFPFYFDRSDDDIKIITDCACYNNKLVLRYSQNVGTTNFGVNLVIEYIKTTD